MFASYERIVDVTDKVPASDMEKARTSAALAYVFFFIPLILHSDNCFARFHCNQAVINLLLSTVGAVLLGLVPYAGPFLLAAQELVCLIIAVRGICLAARGKAVGIPFVGWITIIRY